MNALVSVKWLYENLDSPCLVVLDASLNAQEPETVKAIPGSLFFDLGNAFRVTSCALPNTMVSDAHFGREVRNLGISNDSIVVVYDQTGIYSSARAWWMFRSMGHDKVFVLDGGLPEWERSGFSMSATYKSAVAKGSFEPHRIDGAFVDSGYIASVIMRERIIDVRARDRFFGLTEESRPHLRSGHIPGSVNIPFESVLRDGKLKPIDELNQLFGNPDSGDNLVFSCGSGVTACIGALAAYQCGFLQISVYDGSWSDWGRIDSGFPIA